MKQSEIIVVGGMNVDLKGQSLGELRPRTSNPGRVEVTAGGVGRNIAANLALLGVSVSLLTVAGTDPEGEKIIRETEETGVDMSHLLRIEEARTGIYIALLNNQGEMEWALCDMSVLERLTIEYLQSKVEILRKAKYIICDTNIPQDAVAFLTEFSKLSGVTLCVEPVSVAKSRKMDGFLDGIGIITPNLDELQALTGATITSGNVPQAAEMLISKGVGTIITTLGKDGLCCSTKEGSRFFESYPAEVVDVTGAGDALTAGLVYGLVRRGDFGFACQCGLAAAALTVSSEETVSKRVSVVNIQKLLRNGDQSLEFFNL